MKLGRKKGFYVPREMKEAFELYLETGNRAKVAEELSISEMTLYRWAKRDNWKQKLTEFNQKWMDSISEDIIRRKKEELFFKNPG